MYTVYVLNARNLPRVCSKERGEAHTSKDVCSYVCVFVLWMCVDVCVRVYNTTAGLYGPCMWLR